MDTVGLVLNQAMDLAMAIRAMAEGTGTGTARSLVAVPDTKMDLATLVAVHDPIAQLDRAPAF